MGISCQETSQPVSIVDKVVLVALQLAMRSEVHSSLCVYVYVRGCLPDACCVLNVSYLCARAWSV